jgi:hypothetical protein
MNGTGNHGLIESGFIHLRTVRQVSPERLSAVSMEIALHGTALTAKLRP